MLCNSSQRETLSRGEKELHLQWLVSGKNLKCLCGSPKKMKMALPGPLFTCFLDMKARFVTKKNVYSGEPFSLTRFQGGGNCTHSFRNLLSFPGTEGVDLLIGHRTFFKLGCSPDFLRHSAVSCCNHYFLYLAANKIITER